MRSVREREERVAAAAGLASAELDGEKLDTPVLTSTAYDTADHRLAAVGVTLRRYIEDGRGLWRLTLPDGSAGSEVEAPGGPARPPSELADLLPALLRGCDVAPVEPRVKARGGALGLISNVLRRAVARVGELMGNMLPGGAPPHAGAAVLREALAVQVREVLAHDPGTRLGSDPEQLHDMRVAVRRLRAYLKAAKDALDSEWRDDLRARLKWLGDELGTVRDLDVLVDRLREEGGTLDQPESEAASGLVRALEQERQEARSTMVAALRTDPYFELLDDLEEASRSPRFIAEVDAAELAARAFRKLRKRAERADEDSPDSELHEIRKAGKRARYAAEIAAPVAGERCARFIKEAKRFQDVVGDHQDAVVAEEHLRALVQGRSGPSVLAAGRLIERERARRAAARAKYRKAWQRLERSGDAAWS